LKTREWKENSTDSGGQVEGVGSGDCWLELLVVLHPIALKDSQEVVEKILALILKIIGIQNIF
jgi:hypothetical protein